MECNRVFAIIPHHFTFEILHSVQNDILRTPIFSIFILCIGNFLVFYGKTQPHVSQCTFVLPFSIEIPFTFEILHSVQNDILRTPIFSIFILCIGNFKRFSAFFASPYASTRVITFRLAIFYWNNPFLH